jgi:hypothetical protein
MRLSLPGKSAALRLWIALFLASFGLTSCGDNGTRAAEHLLRLPAPSAEW